MVEIALWNTKTQTQEPFVPLDSANVRMYACGPTVYDRAHIGNARPAVVFDLLFRLLQHEYGEHCVTYVRNITDIDDKINARAAELKANGDKRPALELIREITDRTISWYHEDLTALRVLDPTHEPRATEYVPRMVSLIETLVEKGHAYESHGHVLFSVASYPGYGSLARRSIDEMKAGARVEVAPYKKQALDFVLWKPSWPDQPGWSSPWGRGRPGWHIECSAMSLELLGKTFDIHAGGIDLAFPHHENEAAQSMCAHPNEEFARVWMHNGFLQVEGEKMAKSLGNFVTVKDLLDQGLRGEVLRFVLLSTQYRKPLDWTSRKVAEAESVLRRWWSQVTDAQWFEANDEYLKASPDEVDAEFLDALADDLNTPRAIARMHELSTAGDITALSAAMELMGLELELESESEIERPDRQLYLLQIGVLQLVWEEARKQKDYVKSDFILEQMSEAGVLLSPLPERGFRLTHAYDPEKLLQIPAAVEAKFGEYPGEMPKE